MSFTEHVRESAAGADVEAGARRALRAQIAKLEGDLADTVIGLFDRASPDLAAVVGSPSTSSQRRGGRILTLQELELSRDALARRVVEARHAATRRTGEHDRNWLLLEQMLLEPGRYKYRRLANSELGLGGCGVWRVRPRLGLIGMLAGWWEVRLSSGCPLGGAGRRSDPPSTQEVPHTSAAGARPAVTAAPLRRREPESRRVRSALAAATSRRSARARRWRSVIVPINLFSASGMPARNRRTRVCPHRRWLPRRSESVMFSVSHRRPMITWATSTRPSAIARLSSARASLTSFARSRARRCCGLAAASVAV